jgi:hypothetical protein
MGHLMPAPMTQILFKADPHGPLALIFWIGYVTQRVDPAHSHPDEECLTRHTNGDALLSCFLDRDDAKANNHKTAQ